MQIVYIDGGRWKRGTEHAVYSGVVHVELRNRDLELGTLLAKVWFTARGSATLEKFQWIEELDVREVCRRARMLWQERNVLEQRGKDAQKQKALLRLLQR